LFSRFRYQGIDFLRTAPVLVCNHQWLTFLQLLTWDLIHTCLNTCTCWRLCWFQNLNRIGDICSTLKNNSLCLKKKLTKEIVTMCPILLSHFVSIILLKRKKMFILTLESEISGRLKRLCMIVSLKLYS
jgi:hypothetical protein